MRAMSVAAPATPVKPKTPAMRAITRKVMIQRSMRLVAFTKCPAASGHRNGPKLLLGKCQSSLARIHPPQNKQLKIYAVSPVGGMSAQNQCILRLRGTANSCGLHLSLDGFYVLNIAIARTKSRARSEMSAQF